MENMKFLNWLDLYPANVSDNANLLLFFNSKCTGIIYSYKIHFFFNFLQLFFLRLCKVRSPKINLNLSVFEAK